MKTDASQRKELQVPLIQEVVLDRLREQMADGTFPPGMHLNISEIAVELGVSIVPVREAVKILQSEGRLIRDRSRSYRVRELDHTELVQMNQLSTFVELALIAAGVPKLTDANIEEMVRLSEIVSARVGEKHQILAAHRRLHFVCFEAAELAVFLENATRLWDHYEHYRLLFFDATSISRDATIEHHQFVEACASRDVGEALVIHKRHRQHSLIHLAEIARSDHGIGPPPTV